MSDVKTITTRALNRQTAKVLEAVERGEAFELRRKGKTVAYLTPQPPSPQSQSNWNDHFNWLRQQPQSKSLLKEFEEERRRLQQRESAQGNLE